MASLLYAIELPSVGGDTLFASMTAAYASLSAPMQALLAPLNARHDFRRASSNYWQEEIESDDFDGRNRTVHPVVITHPETKKPVLFVNPGFVAGLVDFTPEESEAILSYLYQHATRPEHIYRHVWQPNDLVIWDNRCLMHYAVADYSEDRYLHRTTVIAEQPSR
jgi:taurine dioxygenase